jgi:hypothetical protein
VSIAEKKYRSTSLLTLMSMPIEILVMIFGSLNIIDSLCLGLSASAFLAVSHMVLLTTARPLLYDIHFKKYGPLDLAWYQRSIDCQLCLPGRYPSPTPLPCHLVYHIHGWMEQHCHLDRDLSYCHKCKMYTSERKTRSYGTVKRAICDQGCVWRFMRDAEYT